MDAETPVSEQIATLEEFFKKMDRISSKEDDSRGWQHFWRVMASGEANGCDGVEHWTCPDDEPLPILPQVL